MFTVCAVCAANKEMTSQMSAFMVEMVCRYTMVAVSQQAGNIFIVNAMLCVYLESLLLSFAFRLSLFNFHS